MNNIFQLYNYPQRLQEGADETSININHLTCTWRVEMKEEDSIKEEGGPESGDRTLKRESTVAIKIVSVNFFS